MLQIASSCSPLQWPPKVVFGVDNREALAGRLARGFLFGSEKDFLAYAGIRAMSGEAAGLRRAGQVPHDVRNLSPRKLG